MSSIVWCQPPVSLTAYSASSGGAYLGPAFGPTPDFTLPFPTPVQVRIKPAASCATFTLKLVAQSNLDTPTVTATSDGVMVSFLLSSMPTSASGSTLKFAATIDGVDSDNLLEIDFSNHYHDYGGSTNAQAYMYWASRTYTGAAAIVSWDFTFAAGPLVPAWTGYVKTNEFA